MFILDNSYWHIQHTPHKGRGIFIRRTIPNGSIIGEYVGTVMPDSIDNEKTDGLYSMWYSESSFIWGDPSTVGIHLVNHSCMPNCAIYPYKDHILYFALRKIFPGEELTVDYLLPHDNDQGTPNPCYCGTYYCRGSMSLSPQRDQEFYDFFVSTQGQWYTSPTSKDGEKIKPLLQYPEQIIDHSIYDLFGYIKNKPEPWEKPVLPTITEVRTIISSTGNCILLVKDNLIIMGVLNKSLVLLPAQAFYSLV